MWIGNNHIRWFEKPEPPPRPPAIQGFTDLPVTLQRGWEQTRLLPRNTAIQAAAADILGAVPDDKTFIVVAQATWYGAKLAALVRGPAGFSFVGYIGREWGGTVAAGAELRFMR